MLKLTDNTTSTAPVAISRRRVLATAAAIATAPQVDRVFAAIDRHRAAYLNWHRLLETQSAIEERLGAKHAETRAAETVANAAGDAEDAARMELAGIVPDTLPGALAL